MNKTYKTKICKHCKQEEKHYLSNFCCKCGRNSFDIIELIKVTKEDYQFLYSLSTNSKVRKYLLSQKKFTYQQHLRYWRTFMGLAYVIYYNGTKAGLLREQERELSIQILPNFWNKGIGTAAIAKYIKNRKGFYARIINVNLASLKVFQNSGFEYSHCVLKR